MFTHVKITRQWKSTLKDKTPHIGRVFSTYTPLRTSVWLFHRQPDKRVIHFPEASLLFAAEQALLVRIL